MLVLKSIDAINSKAVIECNGMPFTVDTKYDLANRGIQFTASNVYETESTVTHEAITRFGLEAIKHSKNLNLDVNSYNARLILESTFGWDRETKMRIRKLVNAERDKKFKEFVADSGLMAIYKKFKSQGAKLNIKQSILNISYRREDPYVYFPTKKMHVEYNTKDKKFVAFIKHGYRRRSRDMESRGSACNAEKMMKKLDKMFLREFLGMPHKGAVE